MTTGTYSGRSFIYDPSGGGPAPAVNPYEAIADLNSLWVTNGANVGTAGSRAVDTNDFPAPVAALQSYSNARPVPLLMQADLDPTKAPAIAPLHGSFNGLQFGSPGATRLQTWIASEDIVADAGNLTLFAIVKTTDAAGAGLGTLYSRGLAAGRWRFGMVSGGFWEANFVDATSAETNISSDDPINDDVIHRAIVVLNQGATPAVTMYIDGVLQASHGAFVGPLQTTTDPIGIGTDGSTAFPFAGLATDIGSYARALSPAEVAQLDAIMVARIG